MFDIYKTITDRIIAALEQGDIPWSRPWVSTGAAVKHVSGEPYSLLNQLLLNRPGEYLTFKQIQQEGGKVRKGEKASMVVLWKWVEKKEEDSEEVKKIPFLKYYNVFHVDQCEGIKPKHTAEMPNVVEADANAEKIIAEYVARTGLNIVHKEGHRAYYSPAKDIVVLPKTEQFKETAEYYSTAFHELVHSTGHESRLNRIAHVAAFGSEDYSKEELVAEIGSATLVNRAGLETDGSFRNSAAYVQNWLKALKNDKRLIVSAAGKAEKAVDFILFAN